MRHWETEEIYMFILSLAMTHVLSKQIVAEVGMNWNLFVFHYSSLESFFFFFFCQDTISFFNS